MSGYIKGKLREYELYHRCELHQWIFFIRYNLFITLMILNFQKNQANIHIKNKS